MTTTYSTRHGEALECKRTGVMGTIKVSGLVGNKVQLLTTHLNSNQSDEILYHGISGVCIKGARTKLIDWVV